MKKESRLELDRFEIDLAEGRLTIDGAPVDLEEKPFRLFVALLERAGETVSREQLYRILWPDKNHLDFSANLNVAVSKLRRALEPPLASKLLIETVPRRGYRLALIAARPSSGTATRKHVVAAASLFAALGFLTLVIAERPPETATLAVVGAAANEIETAEDPEWVMGLDDEVLTTVAGLCPERVAVVWSELVHSKLRDDAASGAEIEADYLLSWTVGGDGSRVHFRLIDTRENRYLWTQSFERHGGASNDTPEEVAIAVATNLAQELLTERIAELAIARLGARHSRPIS